MTTVIACRSMGVMMSDSRVGHGDGKFLSSKKVQRTGHYLVGASGDYAEALAYMRVFKAKVRGRDGRSVPILPVAGGEFELLVLSRHGLWLYGADGTPIEVEKEDVYAIGSGGKCALTSLRTQELLMVPASLQLAVEIACEYDDGSGLPVVSVALR